MNPNVAGARYDEDRLNQLRAERDELQARLNAAISESSIAETGRLNALRDAEFERDAHREMSAVAAERTAELLRAEAIADELAAALNKYAKHLNWCAWLDKNTPCTCGLDAALTNYEQGKVISHDG